MGHKNLVMQPERFWSKVQKDVGDGCWLWMASRDRYGYGRISLDHDHWALAHRVSWELTNGPIPPETPHVLHNCPGADNPACVRHLWLGTQADNIADARSKGRLAVGERHGQSRLTSEQVLTIRQARRNGATLDAIAEQFGVCRDTIWKIDIGKTWTHVA